MKDKYKNYKVDNHWESFIVILIFFIIFFVILSPEMSFAGTGGKDELKAIYDKTEGIVSGYGAKLVALLAFGLGMAGAIKGNPWVFVPGFGTALVASVGPSIFTSGISSII